MSEDDLGPQSPLDTARPLDGAESFIAAARRVVDYLARRTPLGNWSVSRVAGGEQVHVHVHPGAFIETGDRVPWDDTFCRRMNDGAAHVVPDSQLDPTYSCLPDAAAIRAYVGYPINDGNGGLFGILCGVDGVPLLDGGAIDTDLVEMLSQLLSGHLAATRDADRNRREALLAAALADTDALTGLLNRRGWDSLVLDAQQRIDAFGDPVAVAVLDVDHLKRVNDVHGHEAGDDLLRRAGRGLMCAATERDRVARYGGDEFAILTNDVAVDDLSRHYGRFLDALEQQGVEASLGHAYTGPGHRTVRAAFRRADAAMYDAKRARRAS